ncbi:MAG TPA: flagellar motor switch phosphatase FliY [Soehngenia sp.]|nr:flagellar motor switch phosphatase FliY [Soehngenia sp.]HPP31401.1 flagellar motor switch phosphatase FliY [Soehngenia sp.]
MSDNFISQEEIDALLRKSQNKISEDFILTDIDKDIIGEVGNISMSTAATTLSTLLNKRVLITTPRVSWIPFKQVIDECKVPKVVANVRFKKGPKGNNLLMVDVEDASIIADLMMGGDGNSAKKELSEFEMSAVAEAMNQMIGSASTSMATMLGMEIDILPPEVSLWDTNEAKGFGDLDPDKYICKIAFKLDVEGSIESEIMQLYTRETVEEIVKRMKGETDDTSPKFTNNSTTTDHSTININENTSRDTGQTEAKKEEKKEKINIQKPSFEELNITTEDKKNPRNLDLILDVPLEFSVVLGKSKKTIKEVLSFGNGSVIELDKQADEPLEIYVNGKLIAQGEVVVINENFGIRITNIMSKEQRLKELK